MATPTISGAKEMLAYLGANPKDGAKSRKVVITDIREETVVYINGTSFVLRELNKPVETLKHVGITGPAVEHLDGRMDLELVYEDQGFSSAAVQGNHSDNAIDSDDWQRAEPTLHRNFTVRPSDENQKDPPFTKASIEGEEDDGEGNVLGYNVSNVKSNLMMKAKIEFFKRKAEVG
ncbi:hypothetical protein SAY87_008217 [Trapa incisa]|uniref:Uncharacterized protein n=1 Tax=Trapa incisa TaxID=236973 RepID=A0AAN7KGS0_9MYRT|nr:hypothetical protein SAY87_008217 [Trapa incisa]